MNPTEMYIGTDQDPAVKRVIFLQFLVPTINTFVILFREFIIFIIWYSYMWNSGGNVLITRHINNLKANCVCMYVCVCVCVCVYVCMCVCVCVCVCVLKSLWTSCLLQKILIKWNQLFMKKLPDLTSQKKNTCVVLCAREHVRTHTHLSQ